MSSKGSPAIKKQRRDSSRVGADCWRDGLWKEGEGTEPTTEKGPAENLLAVSIKRAIK